MEGKIAHNSGRRGRPRPVRFVHRWALGLAIAVSCAWGTSRPASASEGKFDPIHHVQDRHFEGTFLDQIGITKHVLMLFIVAGLMMAVFIPIGRNQESVPRGIRNFFEAILLYLRDVVVKPILGDHCDRYLPFLWTVFFFILFANLLGAVPFAATATGNLAVTGGLALVAFCFYHGHGIREQGFFHYARSSLVPPGVPLALLPLMVGIELVGHGVRPITLMVRLFANMCGGHIVLSTVYGFTILFGTVLVAPVSIGMGLFIQFLEILVALIQAYVFLFLVTIFLGLSVHPEH